MVKQVKCNRKGFTLIEVIVVAAIIAILAGILVPMIFNQIDESKKARATGDCKSIAAAINVFRKDLGVWPGYKDLAAIPPVKWTILHNGSADSDMPTLSAGFDNADPNTLANHLMKNNGNVYNTTNWKGPYLTSEVGLDPWGKAYVINVDVFDANPSVPVWVISAGPDNVLCTPAASTTIPDGCDDVGIRIK